MEGHSSRIVVVGSGNVATHLAKALDAVGDVVQVWSRTSANADRLASTLRHAAAVCNAMDIVRDADFYIIAVSDDAIADVAARLDGVRGIVAHTSGSYPLQAMAAVLGDTPAGVFYPLQTFSRTAKVDIGSVPFLIEGTNAETVDKLVHLASLISSDVHPIDSHTRGELHVAAVFANNFANYVWDLADRYLRQNTTFDISVFKPLLAETLRKAIEIGPHAAQTGPARRGDSNVIGAHLSKLDDDSAEIYRLLTNHIIKDHEQD